MTTCNKYKLLAERNQIISKAMQEVTLKNKRKLFGFLRSEDANETQLLVYHGITLGEFSVINVINNHQKRQK